MKTMKYSAGQIVVLPGFEAIRKRPDMFVKDSSLLELYRELLESTLDEKYCNRADTVHVEYHTDSSLRIVDDGRGIPITFCQYQGFLRANIEYMFLHLPVGGNREQQIFEEQGHLFGLGTILNALSSLFWVKTVWEDTYYSIGFSRGGLISLLSREPANGKVGTDLYFMPDPDFLSYPKESNDISPCLENIQYKYNEKRISWERKEVIHG